MVCCLTLERPRWWSRAVQWLEAAREELAWCLEPEPAVIIPMYSGPRMLMTRNLIYTAVTRARSCVCLVGRPDAFYTMADNSMEQKRYCGLKARIEEIYA